MIVIRVDGDQDHRTVEIENYDALGAMKVATAICDLVESGKCPLDAWEETITINILRGPNPTLSFYRDVKEEVENTVVDV